MALKNTFSILMLTKNSANNIAKALDSLSLQDFKDWELVVQDCCSKDDTLEIIGSYNFANTKILSQLDTGLYDGLNKAIKRATGGYLMVLHSDDCFASSNTLSQIAGILKDKAPDIIYGDIDFRETNRKPWITGTYSQRFLERGWMIPHTAFIIRRSFHNKVGCYDTSLKIASDYDYEIRALKAARMIHYEKMIVCTMAAGGLSNGSLRKFLHRFKEDYIVCKRYFQFPIYCVIMKRLQKLPQFLSIRDNRRI